jgi:glutaredoxin-like YruB-family protein
MKILKINHKSIMKNVTIYSTPTCHFCHMAKDFFTANSIVFTDHDVASDLEKRKEMIEKSGQMGVPVIIIDGELTVGFDKQRIEKLLGL